MKAVRICALFMTVAMGGSCAMGQPEGRTSNAENIALGKVCTFKPAPNYSLCTDSGDSSQLTDGKISTDTQQGMWFKQETVGWSGANIVYVTVDLTQVMPIEGLAVHTSAGVSGVNWPKYIHIFVSDDGEQYYWVGELLQIDENETNPPENVYSTRWYWTDSLQTYGRYVCLAILPGPPNLFLFLDEIEIYAGSSNYLNQSRPNLVEGSIEAKIPSLTVGQSIIRQKTEDARCIENKVNSSNLSDMQKQEICTNLHRTVADGELTSRILSGTYTYSSAPTWNGPGNSSNVGDRGQTGPINYTNSSVQGDGNVIGTSALWNNGSNQIGSDGVYITFNLGTSYQIRKIATYHYISQYDGIGAVEFYYSNDGVNYILLASDGSNQYCGGSNAPLGWLSRGMTAGTSFTAQYIKLHVHSVPWYHLVLSEVMINAELSTHILSGTYTYSSAPTWNGPGNSSNVGDRGLTGPIDYTTNSAQGNGDVIGTSALWNNGSNQLGDDGAYITFNLGTSYQIRNITTSHYVSQYDGIGAVDFYYSLDGTNYILLGSDGSELYCRASDAPLGWLNRSVTSSTNFTAQYIKLHVHSVPWYHLVLSNVLISNFNTFQYQVPNQYRTVLPLDTQHEEILKAQATYWNANGLPSLCVWPAELWNCPSHLDDPALSENMAICLDMMKNEYRAGVFNISNTTQNPMDVELQITGLPAGTNPDYIQVHEVEWTNTYSAGVVASALPEADFNMDHYVIHIPSGLTRQVWLTFHPQQVEAGEYQGQVQLNAGEMESAVPITLKIYPLQFPDHPSLHFGGWDYVDQGGFGGEGVTVNNRAQFLDLLWTHYVDSPWGAGTLLSAGQYDETGHMIGNPDTTAFDRWLEYWPNARRYYIYQAVNKKFSSFEMGTSEFQTAVKSWITFWMNHARQKGIQPAQIFLLTVDEPLSSVQDDVIISWANAIHEAETGVKIWEDPNHTQPSIDLINVCDAICLNRFYFLNYDSQTQSEYLDATQNTELNFYSCLGPSMELDPYAYYRLQAWTCWQTGAKAMYFWSFSDTGGGSNWNEFASERPGSNFCPFFIDDQSVTTSKQFEACREGIEDYEYLSMLKNAIASAEQKSIDANLLTEAKTLLMKCPGQVLNLEGIYDSMKWKKVIDRQTADEMRIQILAMLSRLNDAMTTQMLGDANGDGMVDVGDLGILAANYGLTNGATWAQGDFNGDGSVDVGDLGILAANYGTGTSNAADFNADYVRLFHNTGMKDEDVSLDDTNSDRTSCSNYGFLLIGGLIMLGLILLKLKE